MPDAIGELFGKRVRLARRAKGISQRELAARMGSPISRQAIHVWETGKGFPRSSQLILLAKVLGVSVDFLMTPNDFNFDWPADYISP